VLYMLAISLLTQQLTIIINFFREKLCSRPTYYEVTVPNRGVEAFYISVSQLFLIATLEHIPKIWCIVV